jgi:hypothetical protein
VRLHDLADLAALLSRHSLHVIEPDDSRVETLAEAFWVHSRRLKGLWEQDMEQFAAAESREEWSELAEEFLTADLLSRVWGGLLLAMSDRQRAFRARGLAQQVLSWNLGLRNRLLQTMTLRWDQWGGHVPRLDLLRRRMERWTDLLLSPLILRHPVDGACFSPERAFDAAPAYDQTRYHAGHSGLWNLTGAALRSSVPDRTLPQGERLKIHGDMTCSILTAFPATAFDSGGVLRSETLRRIFQVVRETSAVAPQPRHRLPTRQAH